MTPDDTPDSAVPAADETVTANEGQPIRGVGVSYFIGRRIIAPVARLFYRPRIEGRHHVPRTGPVILASNHLSFIDSFVIPMASPRAIRFLAKSNYFDGPGVKGWISRRFFLSLGVTPVRRGAGQAALDALEQQKRILESGHAVALYPEGTRSLDGRLYKGRTGVAFLALQTGAQVVPVGLQHTNEAMPVGARFPRMHPRVVIRFGEPIDVTAHGPASSGRARRAATDDIMTAIHALSEQELAGSYNESPAQRPLDRIKQALPHERR